ncbi:hypothetical protein CoNPh10_CDS0006 [Staphylococcus phage S-CoN_Ph10]|nr:hypothetical protein BE22_0082 [Staphylococcus phage vB_SepS_BE22]WNM51403.1 hypothetical protein CoNPh1_CDS0004 [Staphylococcus phage S-CoN_Ph1]WNM51712.1 hypothetical protein CoNPh2_CDS0158 [Staphylococcus phage S-CoN_Ph2]WNM51872.1 hypothetical protein CoNPh3_CDS0158 [Staphylococcus phage S-CoN_Ph3]WNM51880.1 hypothetical protein CoNPh4_CDS0004 [Staphylococcus phage S-CoN_Ph4]WNM52063.1 hypothetical protein CoNPh5_CDS0017 [Staphylococcus phage S-CoN_Ph5]WNM52370.1 hypothetical protein C
MFLSIIIFKKDTYSSLFIIPLSFLNKKFLKLV